MEEPVELTIRGAKVFYNGILFDGGVAVSNGKIVQIGSDTSLPKGDTEIKADGTLLLPGFMDVHIHIYDPDDLGDRDSFDTGTLAAAHGGVTTIIEMPTTTPVVTVNAVKEKIKAGEELSYIDFSLHAGMIERPEDLRDIGELVKLGIASFKAFTAPPFKAEDYTILKLMEKTKSKAVVVVHAENDSIISRYVEAAKKDGRKDPVAHHGFRPWVAEVEAVWRVIVLAGFTGAALHVAHLTTAGGVKAVRYGKSKGFNVTVETCPQYLVLTIKDVDRLGPYAKVNPPLRGSNDVEALWRGLKDGTIDMVATDHYPTFKRQREEGWEDIWKIPSGLPGVETLVPLVYGFGVSRGIIDLNRFVEVLALNPARRFGLYPKKGVIAPGSDADIVLFNPKEEWTIKADLLHHKSDWTPFEGLRVKGRVKTTISRGKVIVKDGETTGSSGWGSFIPRYLRKA